MRKIAACCVLIFFVLNFYSCKKIHHFDDRVTLNKNDKIPYGTYAAFKLLQKEFPHAAVLINKYEPSEWKDLTSDSSKQVLIIVTKIFDPSEDDLDYLTGFVQKGNYVFISALALSESAAKFFKLKLQDHYNSFALALAVHHDFDPFDSTSVNLDSTNFKAPLFYEFPGADFTNRFLKTDSTFSFDLGYSAEKYRNLIAINALKGTYFLHTAPVTFTNFFLLYKDNREYFEKLMSLLPADAKKIVWDEYFLYHYDERDQQQQEGSLSVILKYQNFQWAFWIALLLLSIYVLTEIKRKQRMIPKYTTPKNESLEFVTTIGKLYYEKADHKNLAEKLAQYFLDYVRNRFKISTAEINDSFNQKLAAKSNKPVEEIQVITENIHTINLNESITQKQLMDFYELLEKFYQTA